MYGLILKFYWDGGQDPVVVSQTGTLDDLVALDAIDTSDVASLWARHGIYPVRLHTVRSTITGEMLPAYICGRHQP
jgi:hypothetical protein